VHFQRPTASEAEEEPEIPDLENLHVLQQTATEPEKEEEMPQSPSPVMRSAVHARPQHR
jgi:hypothetical protein